MALPPLLNNALPSASLTNNLFTQDLAAIGLLPPQWGLFDEGGEPVVVADNVTRVEYKQEWSIADYPLEEGQFETYDKVNSPFMARVTFTAGGGQSNREAFLASIASIAGTLEKYTLVTPEVSYANVNVTHYDYTRTAMKGMGLLEVTIWVQEVRTDVSTETADSQEPSGASTTSGGQVQAESVEPGTKTSLLEQMFPNGGAQKIENAFYE